MSAELLPGIPDDITLTYIATKLPWTAVEVLATVSRRWQQAIQTREVYNARVGSHSTETLVAIKHGDSIALYSLRERAGYQLPPIPQGGISRLVSRNGNFYVVGADVGEDGNRDISVLDLAERRQWTQCASAPLSVFENSVGIGYAAEAGHNIVVPGVPALPFTLLWHTFHAVQDGWRSVECCRVFGSKDNPEILFEVQGQLHYMKNIGRTQEIYVNFLTANTSWAHRHSISGKELGPELGVTDRNDSVILDLLFILPMDGELTAIARWKSDDSHRWFRRYSPSGSFRYFRHGYCVLKSRGFGTERKNIIWQIAPHSFHLEESTSFVVCPIQL